MLGGGKVESSLSGDSSDFMGELESVALGLRVPASLGGLEPGPPLTAELGVEDGGRSGDWALSSFLDPGDSGGGECWER